MELVKKIKKENGEKMRSTAEIKEAIAAVKATVTKWQSDKAKQAETRQSLDAIREKFAYQARMGDAAARKKIEKATTESKTLEAEIENIDYAIAGADAEISKLEAEYAAAHRHELSMEFDKVGETLKDQSTFLAGTLSGMAESIAEHAATLRKAHVLAEQLGIGSAPFKTAFFFRYLQAELHRAWPSEFNRPAGDWAEFRDSRYDIFLEKVLSKREEQTEEIRKTGTE